MAKYEEKLSLDLESDEYDILEDIQDDDFVFVVNGSGLLKGISWPTTLEDEDDVDPNIEDLIAYMVKKVSENSRPPDATLH
jgi:hypothetical protein